MLYTTIEQRYYDCQSLYVEGVNEHSRTEVWSRLWGLEWSTYDVILIKAWAYQVDANITCKVDAIHDTLLNDFYFYFLIRNKESSPKESMLSHLQMKKVCYKISKILSSICYRIARESQRQHKKEVVLDGMLFLDEFNYVFPMKYLYYYQKWKSIILYVFLLL